MTIGFFNRLLRANTFALFLVFVGLGFAEESVTPAVGLYRHEVPAGNSAWVAGFVAADVTAGTLSAVNLPLVLQVAGSSWTSNAFSQGHYLEIQSGPQAGRIVEIASNTADSITTTTDLTPLGLVGGERIVIRPHATLSSLFPKGGGLTPYKDYIRLFDAAGSHAFTFDSKFDRWVSTRDYATDGNAVVIRPGQGFIIYAGDRREVLVGSGAITHVKYTPTLVEVPAGSRSLIGPINPLVAYVPDAPVVAPIEEYPALDLGSDAHTTAVRLYSHDGLLTTLGEYLLSPSGAVPVGGTGSVPLTLRTGQAGSILPSAPLLWTLPAFSP